MRTKRLSSILLLSLFAFTAAPTLPAQNPVANRKMCVFTIQNLTPGGAFAEYEASITETVEQEFDGAGARLIKSGAWSKAARMPQDPRDLLRSPAALAVAEDVGAELAVNGSYIVEDEQILISLQCWDVAAKAPVSGFLRSWRFNLAFYNSLHEEITSKLVPRIALRDDGSGSSGASTGSASASARAVTEISFLSPDEGMELLIEGDTPAGMIEDGRLTWAAGGVPQGTRLMVTKKKPGFHTTRQAVRVNPEIKLSPLPKETKESVEVDWTFGQLVGLGCAVRGYAVPDTFFTWVGSYLSLQLPTTSAGRPVFHSDTGAGLGLYVLLPPGSRVRLGLSTGMGAIFTYQPIPGA
ncbi:MAG: hypothetical protein NT005_07965, partial [Spirochaetes bacterium]|nr:hypothetical protein [Spirochaetota bacterium]